MENVPLNGRICNVVDVEIVVTTKEKGNVLIVDILPLNYVVLPGKPKISTNVDELIERRAILFNI